MRSDDSVSFFAENQIDDPAAADMRSGPTAVVEDIAVGARRILQRVGEDRHDLPAAVLVDRLRQFHDGPVVPRQPVRVDGGGLKRIAKDAVHEQLRTSECTFRPARSSQVARRLLQLNDRNARGLPGSATVRDPHGDPRSIPANGITRGRVRSNELGFDRLAIGKLLRNLYGSPAAIVTKEWPQQTPD